jgi:hypothetical protein
MHRGPSARGVRRTARGPRFSQTPKLQTKTLIPILGRGARLSSARRPVRVTDKFKLLNSRKTAKYSLNLSPAAQDRDDAAARR